MMIKNPIKTFIEFINYNLNDYIKIYT